MKKEVGRIRISALQKNTLFLLHAFSEKGKQAVRMTALLNILRHGCGQTFQSNFSVSCRTLRKNGLLNIRYDSSLRAWLSLTDAGRPIAQDIYIERGECE